MTTRYSIIRLVTNCPVSGGDAAFGWMSLVKVLFWYTFRILVTRTLNLRKLIFDYGKYSHWSPFGSGNVKFGRWTRTFWTNTLAPSWGQKWLLDTNYPEYGGSLLHFVMTHKQETRLSNLLTSDIPMTVHTSSISNYCTKLFFTL
jgi:hypothetical protein